MDATVRLDFVQTLTSVGPTRENPVLDPLNYTSTTDYKLASFNLIFTIQWHALCLFLKVASVIAENPLM